MSLVYSARLKREIVARRRTSPHGASQQFGQSGDISTFGGSTGCTHTVLQWMLWRSKGKWRTHDELSRIALYPFPKGNPNRRGFRPAEVQRILDHYGMPYKIVRGWPALSVWKASKLGLVGFGHLYPWWPEWRGFRYGSVKADGKPNGYATPTGKAGRTQLAGFYGRHFGMLLGYATQDGPDLGYAWEPNHGSSVRPERPPYDRMSFHQFENVFNSFKSGGQSTYAVVPKGATR
jgi:hypothetical protein